MIQSEELLKILAIKIERKGDTFDDFFHVIVDYEALEDLSHGKKFKKYSESAKKLIRPHFRGKI